MVRRVVSLLAPLVLALALVGCGGDGGGNGGGAGAGGGAPGDGGTGAAPTADGTTLAHIHGLGINPADGALYAAAHSGVYRIKGGRAERVSQYQQDTMAFTVLGPDHFAASGHPDPRDDAFARDGVPPHLGLVESDDGGRSWQPVSLLGEADFHALSFAHDRVYGYDATGRRFMVSADRRSWDTRSSGIGIIDFAVDPDDPDVVVAGDAQQTLASADGGRSWEPVDGGPGIVFVEWSAAAGVVALDRHGTVLVSGDGASFREVGDLGSAPAALLLTDDAWYAGVEGGAILSSDDEGKTWQVVFEEGSRRSR